MSDIKNKPSIFSYQGDCFPKSEKLSSPKIIHTLFNKRQAEFIYPFKVVYLRDEQQKPSAPQVLISVSKKKFKRAVDRNRIKRQIREIYRQHKREIFKPHQYVPHYIAIIFVAKKQENFIFMEKRLVGVLTKISHKTN